MSKIRLHGSSSGYTEIAPVAASGNNTLTLPNDGTIISKDSAGAIGVTSAVIGNSGTTTIASDGTLNSTGLIGSSPSSGNTMSIRHDGTNGSINNSNGNTLLYTSDDSGELIIHRTASNTQTFKITAAGLVQFDSGFGSVVTAYGVRAWADIYWNSGTPTARANGNVSSISDDGTGDMTISFSTAMPDTNYACLVSGDDYGNSSYPGFNVGFPTRGKTTGGVSLNATQKDGTARDIAAVNFAVIR